MTAPMEEAPPKAAPPPPKRSAESPPASPPAPRVRPMPAWRVWMVLGVAASIIGGHAFEAIKQKEHWPFSPYQMWSISTKTWELNDERLYGVTDEPSPREILLNDPSYFYPLPSRFMRLHMINGINEKQQKGTSAHLDAITT